MSFAVVLEGMTVIAYVIIMAGGKQKRVGGWKILSGFHVLVGILLGGAMSIIVSVPTVELRVSRSRKTGLTVARHTSTITTTASSPAGGSIAHGSSVQPASASSC